MTDQSTLHTLIRAAEAHIPREVHAEPAPHRMSYQSRRAHGIALSEHVLGGPGRSLAPRAEGNQPDEEYMLDLELREDGGLRLLVGRLTAKWGQNQYSGERMTVILDAIAIAVAFALRLVRRAVGVADATGYRGEWALGVHGTGLRGLFSSVHMQSDRWGAGNGDAFDAEEYRETTTATYREMTDQPTAVAERLVGRLTRALGTDHHWSSVLGTV